MTDHDNQPTNDRYNETNDTSGSASPPRPPLFEETEADDAVEGEFVYMPAPGIPDDYSHPSPDDGEDKVDGEGAWACPPDPATDTAGGAAPNADDRPTEEGEVVKDISTVSRDAELQIDPANPAEAGIAPAVPGPVRGMFAAPIKLGGALKPHFGQRAIPIGAIRLFPHIVIDPSRVAPVDIEGRASEISSFGQRFYPKARPLEDGMFEVANNVIDVLAVQHLDKGAGTTIILVDVGPLSDEDMFVFAHQEGRASAAVVPYDRARSLRAAMETLDINQKQAAKKFGFDPATVTNTLYILKVAARLKPEDPWAITENQAKRFQKLQKDETQRDALNLAIAGLDTGKARKQLTAIFAACSVSSKNSTPILDADDNEVGSISKGNGGKVTIKLTAAAGNVPADELGAILAAEIGKQRQ